MKVLVCNAGSTSLKFKLFEMPDETLLAEGKIERVGSDKQAIFHYKGFSNDHKVLLRDQDVPTYESGIRLFLEHLLDREKGVLDDISQVDRVGFKTVLAKGFLNVHELTDEVLEAMEAYYVVAPAHNGPYLATIRQFRQILPDAMLVGVFETAFHTTIPPERKLYGVPYEWYEEYGVQRFGYHGASHSYIAEFIAQEEGGTGRLISCHLGGSGSICAIKDGKSMDNSFGFSLQTGLIHANRIGDTDPYLFPFLLAQGKDFDQILRGMDKEGGILGISGIGNDLRDIEDAAKQGHARARLAIDAYCYGIIKYIGAYSALIGGVDHLVFTGGIGENSDVVRGAVCGALEHFGVLIDEDINRVCRGKTEIISKPESPIRVWVIPANEELGVARKTFRLGE